MIHYIVTYFLGHPVYTLWPNKKYATFELSLNRIEKTSIRLDFKCKFERKRNSGMLSISIEYSVHDPCMLLRHVATTND